MMNLRRRLQQAQSKAYQLSLASRVQELRRAGHHLALCRVGTQTMRRRFWSYESQGLQRFIMDRRAARSSGLWQLEQLQGCSHTTPQAQGLWGLVSWRRSAAKRRRSRTWCGWSHSRSGCSASS